jgi:hypothetical protein
MLITNTKVEMTEDEYLTDPTGAYNLAIDRDVLVLNSAGEAQIHLPSRISRSSHAPRDTSDEHSPQQG